MAAGVELSTRICVRSMKSDDLVADEVVARGEAGGDGVGGTSSVGHEGCVAPDVRGTFPTFFLNFEPDSATQISAYVYRFVRRIAYSESGM